MNYTNSQQSENNRRNWIIYTPDLSSKERGEFRKLVREEKVRQLNAFCWVLKERWDRLDNMHRLMIRAAAFTKVSKRNVVIGSSAALLHGFKLEHERHRLVVGNVCCSRKLRFVDQTRSWCNFPKAAVVVIDSIYGEIRVSSPEQTLVDLGRWGDDGDCLIAGDIYIGQSVEKRRKFIDAVVANAQRAGIVAVRRLTHIVTGWCESPQESLLKYRFWKRGFPPPKMQVTVYIKNLGKTFRPDFLFDDGAIVEYDGMGKVFDYALKVQTTILIDLYHRSHLLQNCGFRMFHVDRKVKDSAELFASIWAHLASAKQRKWWLSDQVKLIGGCYAWECSYKSQRRRPVVAKVSA